MASPLQQLESPGLLDFSAIPESPAFVYSIVDLVDDASLISRIADEAGCSLLYSVKACEVGTVLGVLAPHLSGFATSSLFEARLARAVLDRNGGTEGEVHLFMPGLRAEEVDQLAGLCDYISMNSLGQLARYGRLVGAHARCGLRVNPGLSYVGDDRYDPGRRHSKLGVGIDDLLAAERASSETVRGLSGLHVHVNCDSDDLGQLLETVLRLDARLGPMLSRMEWVNLGGGYLFGDSESLDPFYEAVSLLRSKYDLRVIIEPGAAMVRRAGYMVSTVLDLFESDGKQIAVLDATVNHMPEVFEYQFSPDVMGSTDEGGSYGYILAGCSCLAGDVFGEYWFMEPLEVGSRVVFENVGAYALSKAHMFNGINLPSVYVIREDGQVTLSSRSTEDEFLARSGVGSGAAV